MTRRKILALSFFPAFVPPTNGGVARLTHLYTELSRHYDIVLVSSGEVGAETERVRHAPHFEEIRVGKDATFQSLYVDLASDAYRGDISGPANGLWSRHAGPLHNAYLEHYAQADIIIHDSPFLLDVDCFRGLDRKVRVYNSYNVEADLYAGFGASETGERIAALVASLEGELVGAVDLVTACSDEDRLSFQQAYAPSCPIEIVPNGVALSPRGEGSARPRGERVVFLGSNHKPNNDAARYIVDTLAAQLPDLRIDIVGSCIEPGTYGNVIAHGLVDAERKAAILRSAGIAINPVVSGSGSSLKIAEFAASGVPLVSTVHGARGFDFEPAEHYLAAQPDDFAEAVTRLLANPAEGERLAANAERQIRSHFGWGSIADRMNASIEAIGHKEDVPRPFLLLNDYDPFAHPGGGSTRTIGIAQGLLESRPVVLLTMVDEGGILRSVHDGIVVLRVPRTTAHAQAQVLRDRNHWMSLADVTAYQYAPRDERLVRLFEAALTFAERVICEHPYMVGLPRLFGADFVYSSQNCELQLKRSTHADHPAFRAAMAVVEECEAFACGGASLITTVSASDAATMSAIFAETAPIIVIRNGSDGVPESLDFGPLEGEGGRGLSCIFMGSGHPPNVEAARWIIERLAPLCPDIDFHLMGSVCTTIGESERPNVVMLGVVDDAAKHEALARADLALNPMSTGSGSNIKVADYLQHGLKVLSTRFGARGYDDVEDADLLVAQLEDFANVLHGFARETADQRTRRAADYRHRLSMVEGGRELARQLLAPARAKRALYVTYRYIQQPRGGGEIYVDRLIGALGKSGWAIDVACADVDRIVDVARFAAAFTPALEQAAPIGLPSVRVAKFEVDPADSGTSSPAAIWAAQPAFEEAVVRAMPAPSGDVALGWGWGWPEAGGRWAYDDCGLFSREGAKALIAGQARTPATVRIRGEDGSTILATEIDGHFALECALTPGWNRLSVDGGAEVPADDPRPLGLFVHRVDVGEHDLIAAPTALQSREVDPRRLLAALDDAREAVRHPAELRLSDLRDPSSALNAFVDEEMGVYDLLVTHNAVFGSSTHAIAAAKRADVPSILVPHLHLDDDFYHFDDVLEACRDAGATLVSPSSAVDFMRDKGIGNARFFTPGIDVNEPYDARDEAAFRALLGRDDPFFLVLGRKAGAKRYADTIDAAAKVEGHPLVVLIGPDDDGVPIDDDRVLYLGLQPRGIVRGALRACCALVNMSESESFGIVLLEAGLAGRPVVANRHCAAFADLVVDGENGVLCDVAQLPGVLRKLLDDEAMARAMGESGRQRARNYDWTGIEDAFVALCDDMAEIRHGL